MTARQLIEECIINPMYWEQCSVIAFCDKGRDWYHVHKDEELPKGHICLCGLPYEADLYVQDISQCKGGWVIP